MFKPSEDIQPISELKRRASAIVDHATETGRPVILTKRGRGVAVLLSLEEFEELREAAGVAELNRALDAGLEDIENGRLVAHEEVMSSLRNRRRRQ